MFKDRVRDTTTTTGTGPVTLSGAAPAGFITFDTAFGHVGTTFYYCIEDGTNWEVGEGTLTTATTLARTTVLASSNAGALENFPSGTKQVFCTIPADYLDGLSSLTNAGTTDYLAKTDSSGNLVNSLINDDGTSLTASCPVAIVITANTAANVNACLSLDGDTSAIGDVNGNFNGTKLAVNDSAETIALTAVSGATLNGTTLPTNTAVANAIPKSDGTNLVASQITDDGTTVGIVATNVNISGSASFLLTGAPSRLELGSTAKLGDTTGSGSGTVLEVDDTTQTVFVNGAGGCKFDDANSIATIGDHGGAGSSLKIVVDDANKLITIDCGIGGNIALINLQTSNPGGSGLLWNDSGTLKIT